MTKHTRVLVFVAALALCCLHTCKAWGQRVLIVTTEQQSPAVWSHSNGMQVLTDLVSHGYSFDLVTYGRFVSMDLGDHDVVFLNGHTSPTSITSVIAKCQAALAEGRKVFINGNQPFQQYDALGKNPVTVNYATTLFNVISNGGRGLIGTPVLSKDIEKDPAITNTPLRGTYATYTFRFSTPPSRTISCGGHTFGFLYPQGGMVDGSCSYFLSLLDYGKVVTFLRYGDRPAIGFSNDRMAGEHIAAFDVHCDSYSDLTAISNLNALAQRLSMPLMNILVNERLNSAAVARWNAVSGPLMQIGTHTMTHPFTWAGVDINYEVVEALPLLRQLIPSTRDYFIPSGNQMLSAAQMDVLTGSGVLSGGSGADSRHYSSPATGASVEVQRMPTCIGWFRELSKSTTSPYYLSMTLRGDHGTWAAGDNFLDEVKKAHASNLKYGMYNYGGIHDYMLGTSASSYTTNGVSVSALISAAMDYLHAQGVRFISPELLIRRLNDYLAGRIDRVENPDGTTSVTVTRPNAMANDIKIGFKGDLTPQVVSPVGLMHRAVGEYVYVALPVETTTAVLVQWIAQAPVTPVVTTSSNYISNGSSVAWTVPVHPSGIVEYQYAVGTTSGGTDAQGWTSAGTAASAVLSAAQLVHGQTYYASVRARYAASSWSPVGTSAPLVADMTPPSTPIVTDDGESQEVDDMLHVSWDSSDPESGVAAYRYAVGTAPGAADLQGWADVTGASVTLNLQYVLEWGKTYYFSVQARNGVGVWSNIGISDGITVMPGIVTIGVARSCRLGTRVNLVRRTVTAVFAGEFYMEEQDRSAAIKVISDELVAEGDQVNVSGTADKDVTERIIRDATVNVVYDGVVRPLWMRNSCLGGAGNTDMPGPSDGEGVNNMGLLVTTSGRILRAYATCLYIDDGSKVDAGSGQRGVRVLVTSPHDFHEQQFVIVTGISALTVDSGDFRRTIRTRRNSDVIIRQ